MAISCKGAFTHVADLGHLVYTPFRVIWVCYMGSEANYRPRKGLKLDY